MGAPEIRCIPYIFKFMSAFFGGAGRSRERDAASELRHIIPSKMRACVCVCIFVVRFIVSITEKNRHTYKGTGPIVCLFVRCVCQGRPSYGWTKRDVS